MSKILLTLLLAMGMQAACAESRFWGNDDRRSGRNDSVREFHETDIELPAVPDAQQDGWFDLYVSPIFRGKPQILLDSITYAPDGSVRYLFNNRSSSGYDNITAEGLLCVTGMKLFNNESAKVKIFAYADTTKQRWIMPRNAQWQAIGGKHNSNDQVRRVLYEAFCIDGRAKDDAALRARLVKQAGHHFSHDHSK